MLLQGSFVIKPGVAAGGWQVNADDGETRFDTAPPSHHRRGWWGIIPNRFNPLRQVGAALGEALARTNPFPGFREALQPRLPNVLSPILKKVMALKGSVR